MTASDAAGTGANAPVPASRIEIGDLADLDFVTLRSLWLQLYGSPASTHMSAALLRLAVAYRLQEVQHGGLSAALRKRLANAANARGSRPRTAARRTIKPGTRFLREWRGRTHEVVATADGRYDYRGTAYSSLSAIAREITGTRWSGPAFFGLHGDD